MPPQPEPEHDAPRPAPEAAGNPPAEDPPAAPGPDPERMKADLRDGVARMKGLVEQLRRRLDRRREPREP